MDGNGIGIPVAKKQLGDVQEVGSKAPRRGK
jgi:hypothetical protein